MQKAINSLSLVGSHDGFLDDDLYDILETNLNEEQHRSPNMHKKLNFEDVVNLEIGDFVEEHYAGTSVTIEVLTKPEITSALIADIRRGQVTFKGRNFYEGDVDGNKTYDCDFLVTKGLEHYGPQLYSKVS